MIPLWHTIVRPGVSGVISTAQFLLEIRSLRVDFHLVQNVARASFSYCFSSSRMEPNRNIFNFNYAAVAHATFPFGAKCRVRDFFLLS